MLNYRELAALGFCPAKNYSWMKPFQPGFKLPAECSHKIWPSVPLHIQIFYEQYATNGSHPLRTQL